MNKLQLIDADTLYYKPLAHPKMLIDGVLSDGLAILAGDSKIGKSWMVLWLCLQISRGEAVWGLPTRKTNVVYLSMWGMAATCRWVNLQICRMRMRRAPSGAGI